MSVNSSKIRWCQTYIHVISTTNAVLFHFKLTICLPSIVSRTSLAVYKERTIRTINPKIKKKFPDQAQMKIHGFLCHVIPFLWKKIHQKSFRHYELLLDVFGFQPWLCTLRLTKNFQSQNTYVSNLIMSFQI